MDYITGKHIPRRTFLRGMGATVALPFLDAMVPAGRRASGAHSPLSQPTRLVCIEEVHGLPGCNDWGASQHLFGPETTGRDFVLSDENTLAPLRDYQEYLTIISNTAGLASVIGFGTVPGDRPIDIGVLVLSLIHI